MNVTDATPRMAARRQALRRRRQIVVGSVAGFVVVALVALYVVLWSPVFAVHDVKVEGATILSADDVRQAAGIPEGASLALVDVDGAASHVNALPPVAHATVTREWPTTLRITVTERQPSLSIAWDGQYLIADASGVVFQTASRAPSGLIPVAVNPDDRQLVADTGVVYSSLSAGVQKKVRTITAKTPDSITIELKSGPTVVWGDASQSDLKSQVLDSLIDAKVSVIDVSSPSTPATKP